MKIRATPLFPDKPAYIARDVVASAEFDRIVQALRRRTDLVEVGVDPLAFAAGSYGAIFAISQCLAEQGRTLDTQPMVDDLAHLIASYRSYMNELEIGPGPLVQIRALM